MIKDFRKLLKFKNIYLVLLVTLIVVFFEFVSYGLAYPIISIFLDLDQGLIPKINNFIFQYTNYQLNLDEKLIVIFLIIVLFLQSLSFVLFRYLVIKSTLRYLRDLRYRIYNNFFSTSYNPNKSISETLNAMTTQSLNSFHFWNLYIECIKRLLIIIAITVLFVLISFKILLTSVLILGILVFFTNKISKLSKNYGRNMTIIDQNYLQRSSESLRNYRYIKITNIKDKIFLSIKKKIEDYNTNQFYFTMLSKLIKETSEPIAIILIILIGYTSTYLLDANISLVIISVLLLRRLIAHIFALFNSYQSLLKNRESLIYIEKISNNFNNVETDYNIKLRKQFQNMKLQNISYDYGLNKKIFYNLNLDLDKYSSIIIFGKSGSGKSTLINLITGIIHPYSGKVLYNDVDINKNNNERNAFNIGMVSQDEVVFNMSLLDNFLLRNPKAKKTKIYELINLLGLNSLFKDNKIDLSINVNESNSNLSGGEKQKIAIIRELLSEPDFLILDEPTSSLDKISLIKCIKLFKKISSKTTMIIFTHQHEYNLLPFKKYNIQKNKLYKK